MREVRLRECYLTTDYMERIPHIVRLLELMRNNFRFCALDLALGGNISTFSAH